MPARPALPAAVPVPAVLVPAVLVAVVLVAVVVLLAGCGSPPLAQALDPVAAPALLPVAPAVAGETPLPAALLRAPATTAAAEDAPAGEGSDEAGDGRAAARPGGGPRVDTGDPDRVVGEGTPSSCTSAAVVEAVAAGGVITFSCGPEPVTIRLQRTAVVDNRSARVVLDGGGLVTLSGGGERRILYQNTCDPEIGFTTPHCDDQAEPHLVLQDIGLTDGRATGTTTETGGGGAVFVRGGRLTVVGARFTGNRCHAVGPDLGGAALRVLDQFEDRPVVVSDSTFTGGSCANGGALSSIGVSWTIRNSVFRDNEATGEGANPARAGTPGGGSGGAVYADGNGFVVDVAGSVIEDNRAAEGGGAIFFVSNDRSGELRVDDATVLRRNPSGGFETDGRPGIFVLDRTT